MGRRPKVRRQVIATFMDVGVGNRWTMKREVGPNEAPWRALALAISPRLAGCCRPVGDLWFAVIRQPRAPGGMVARGIDRLLDPARSGPVRGDQANRTDHVARADVAGGSGHVCAPAYVRLSSVLRLQGCHYPSYCLPVGIQTGPICRCPHVCCIQATRSEQETP
jgi:hypothetical protein